MTGRTSGYGMTEVLTGAADWRTVEWRDSYYPGDLPEEWQLAYYANEYGTTLIDCREYMEPQRLEALAEMLEDCAYSFRPILRVHADANTPAEVSHFMQWLNQLDEHIGTGRLAGVWLSLDMTSLEESRLLAWRAAVPEKLPVALDTTPELSDEEWRWLAEQGFSVVWRPGLRSHALQRFWLARLSLAAENRRVAVDIGKFLQVASAPDVVCIVVAEGYQDASRLAEVSTIVQLVHK